MIRFHAPVRSTTLNVYAVVVIVVTLEIQERIQHDDDDDPTTRNSSYHLILSPLPFFSSPLLEMIGVATHDTHDGSSRISELDGFNCSWCWPRPTWIVKYICYKYTLSVFVDMIKKRSKSMKLEFKILIESIFCNYDFF